MTTTNRLADESSPYLRQHAANPVDWYPWGDEAFATAEKRDVPVLLSIGYSACHWCHVAGSSAHRAGKVRKCLARRHYLFRILPQWAGPCRGFQTQICLTHLSAHQATRWPALSAWPRGRLPRDQ